jgi:predicted nucleotidyltransferase
MSDKLTLDKIYNGNLLWLNARTIFATMHGSRAYGTNTPESDIDIKGVCVPPREYYLGYLNKFEQAIQNDPYDMVIYELRKFLNLASDCNPNIIEVLFTNPEDHVQVTNLGQILLDNKQIFISKKARYTFSGYAIAQLKRIKGHYQWIKNPPKAPPTRKELGLPERTLIPADQIAAAQAEIRKKLDSWNLDFLDGLESDARIAVINNVENYLTELKISKNDNLWIGAARTLGYNDNFIELLDKERQYNSRKETWNQYQNWKENRNPVRAAIEEKFGYDCKHAYHLIRLMRMAHEILTTGKVIVKRHDREELLAIRYGSWTYEQLLEWAEAQDKLLQKVYEDCTIIPNSPDRNAIDKLCIALVEQML